MHGGSVPATGRRVQFNMKGFLVTNTTLPNQAREMLQQIISSCPLRAHGMAAGGNKNNSSASCEIENVEVSEDKHSGWAFACRHAEGEVCAGQLATE